MHHVWIVRLPEDEGKWSDTVIHLTVIAETIDDCKRYMQSLEDSGELGRTSGGCPIEIDLTRNWEFNDVGYAGAVSPGVYDYVVSFS